MADSEEQTEDAGTEDDLETSDTDQDEDLSVSGPSAVATSSFSKHVEYKLSKVEAEDLSKKRWKYMWEVPAVDISNCNWAGTGECFLKIAIHLALILGPGKLFRFDLKLLLIASNANGGGPTTECGMATAKGWSSMVVPGILASIFGIAIATFLSIAFGVTVLKFM